MVRIPKLIILLTFATISLSVNGQSENSRVAEYIKQYKILAINEMVRSGVPASITLAQGILETGGGQSDLAEKANNHFGIKCKSEWTGETMLHDDDAKNECFRKYPTVEASYQDHSEFLKTRPNYAFLFKLDPTDYEGWAKGLKKAGYATNPAYPQRLMKIIVENNLQEFTLLALNGREKVENELFVLKENNEPRSTFTNIKESSQATNTSARSKNMVVSAVQKSVVQNKKSAYPFETVFAINEAKVIYSAAGVSLLALANQYNISYKKLLEFNDLDETDILSRNQLIFLQKKQKKGSKEIHVVEDSENLHDICQKEGIQLASLLELNRLKKGMEPAMGENLYLKSPAPVSPRLARNAKLAFENNSAVILHYSILVHVSNPGS